MSVYVLILLIKKNQSNKKVQNTFFCGYCVFFISIRKRASWKKIFFGGKKSNDISKNQQLNYISEEIKMLLCWVKHKRSERSKRVFDSFVKCLAFMTPSTYLKRFELSFFLEFYIVLVRRYNPTRHQKNKATANAKLSTSSHSLTSFFSLFLLTNFNF